jgi:hypothetical protein
MASLALEMTMKRSLACVVAALACLATMSWAATGPFVQVLSPSSSLANTCTAGSTTSTVLANVDLPPGASYRYEVAFLIVPDPTMDMDMDMMMMMMGGGGAADPYYALLYQSPAINGPTVSAGASLSIGAPAQWYTTATVPGVADHTTIMAQVTTFAGANGSGAVAASSALSWDCTTGQVLARSNTGNADGATLSPGPGLVQVIEYYNAATDHYFLTSVSPEIATLDAGQIAGWVRTGYNFNAFADAVAGASPVCRLYLPPVYGDSHFFSALPAECAYVQAAMPAAVLESANAFYVDTPDTTTGVCPSGTVAVYRLWNHRADLDHRYTTSATIKAAMIAQGYVAEGYGPDQVMMCSPQ